MNFALGVETKNLKIIMHTQKKLTRIINLKPGEKLPFNILYTKEEEEEIAVRDNGLLCF